MGQTFVRHAKLNKNVGCPKYRKLRLAGNLIETHECPAMVVCAKLLSNFSFPKFLTVLFLQKWTKLGKRF